MSTDRSEPLMCCQDDAGRAAGAEALQRVHMAKDELRQRDQQKHCSVPVPPEQAQGPRCTSSVHRDRKYEIHWSVPPHQDPNRPVLPLVSRL
eukprot:3352648-Amphidinium_carterae.2